MSDMQFTDESRDALANAVSLAEEHSHGQLLPLHLAITLLEPPTNASSSSLTILRQIVARIHGDPVLFRRHLLRALVRLPNQEPPPASVSLSPKAVKMLRVAQELQKKQNDPLITEDHILVALSHDSDIHAALTQANVPVTEIQSLEVTIKELRNTKSSVTKEGEVEFVTDITALAKNWELDPTIGRDEEIRRLIIALSRRTVNNAILVGQSGIGKTSIVNGLADRIIQKDVPSNFEGYRILSLNVGSLTSEPEFHDKFEERLRGILKAMEKSEPTCLFIDDVHLLMGFMDKERSKNSDIGDVGDDLLRSLLLKKQLHHCIAATTPADYHKYISKNPALEEQFGLIPVKAPNFRETISILRGLRDRYEIRYGVDITDEALVEAATLAGEYFPSKTLSKSAIDLIDETATSVAVTSNSEPEELKTMERKARQLRTEMAGLQRDVNQSSSHYIQEIRTELYGLEERSRTLRETYTRLCIARQNFLQDPQKLEQLRMKMQSAENTGDVMIAADIKYYAIPELQLQIDQEKLRIKTLEADLLNQMKTWVASYSLPVSWARHRSNR